MESFKTAKYFLFVLLLGFLVEAVSASLILGRQLALHRPIASFADQFLLTSLTISPFLHEAQQYQNYKDIGDLGLHYGNWKAMNPPDPLLGVGLGRGIKATNYGKYTYVINKQGFASIGEEPFFYAKEKPNGIFRVIVLGGSTVFGQGVPFPQQNLPAQIKHFLTERFPNLRIELVNAGRAGYNSSQEFLYLISELVYYHPDLVIVYDGWNDENYNPGLVQQYAEDLIPLRNFQHYKLEERMLESYDEWGTIKHVIEVTADNLLNLGRRSAFLEFIIKSIFWIQSRFQHGAPTTNHPLVYNPRSVTIYRDNIERMIVMAKLGRFKAAFYLQPIIGGGGKPLTAQEAKLPVPDPFVRRTFYSEAAKAFQELGAQYGHPGSVSVKDLSNCFENTSEQVYEDSGHINFAGNQIVAKAIVNDLTQKSMMADYNP